MARRRPQAPAWTREGVKRRLVERFWTRFHMSLILVSCALAAMLANWALRAAGVDAMLVRYPIAVAVSYLVFLLGVWIWLRYVGIHPKEEEGDPHGNSVLDAADLPDIPVGRGGGGSGSAGGFGGKGGSFDGGGASASWAEGGALRAPNVQALAASSPGDSADAPSGLGDLVSGASDADELVLVALALAVVVAILAASGYLVWMAPDILAEAAFGALLAGGLARPSRREDAAGWIAGVAKKTWWPFAIVLVLALAFAGFAASAYPQARTFGEAWALATAPSPAR